jgi:hypothetical protein
MLGELAAHHGVHAFRAVLKARNVPSRRLLERLGFVPAPPALLARLPIDDDELMMVHEVPRGVR